MHCRLFVACVGLVFLMGMGDSHAWGAKKLTAAPPDVQDSINGFLKMTANSRACKRVGKPMVLSSEPSEGARFSPEGRLLEGEIVEVWETRMCGERMRYRFTIGTDRKGAVSLAGVVPLK